VFALSHVFDNHYYNNINKNIDACMVNFVFLWNCFRSFLVSLWKSVLIIKPQMTSSYCKLQSYFSLFSRPIPQFNNMPWHLCFFLFTASKLYHLKFLSSIWFIIWNLTIECNWINILIWHLYDMYFIALPFSIKGGMIY